MSNSALAQSRLPDANYPTSRLLHLQFTSLKANSLLSLSEQAFCVHSMSYLSENPWPWKEPSSPVPRGAFIVIEGLDRAGKTTQVKRLCDKLYSQSHNIKTIRFPGKFQLLTVQNRFLSRVPWAEKPAFKQTGHLQLAK